MFPDETDAFCLEWHGGHDEAAFWADLLAEGDDGDDPFAGLEE